MECWKTNREMRVSTKQAYNKRKRDRNTIKQLNKPSPQEDCRKENDPVSPNQYITNRKACDSLKDKNIRGGKRIDNVGSQNWVL